MDAGKGNNLKLPERSTTTSNWIRNTICDNRGILISIFNMAYICIYFTDLIMIDIQFREASV